jgi:DNA-binding NtrC family response regulator
VRQLRNAIERAVLVCSDGAIRSEHLLLDEARSELKGLPAARAGESADETPPPSDRELDKRRIEEALASCGGNQSRAAKLLGIARSTLVLRLEIYGITRPRKR